jgi:hypothetical protein
MTMKLASQMSLEERARVLAEIIRLDGAEPPPPPPPADPDAPKLAKDMTAQERAGFLREQSAAERERMS